MGNRRLLLGLALDLALAILVCSLDKGFLVILRLEGQAVFLGLLRLREVVVEVKTLVHCHQLLLRVRLAKG
jgi:hypothetical protein